MQGENQIASPWQLDLCSGTHGVVKQGKLGFVAIRQQGLSLAGVLLGKRVTPNLWVGRMNLSFPASRPLNAGGKVTGEIKPFPIGFFGLLRWRGRAAPVQTKALPRVPSCSSCPFPLCRSHKRKSMGLNSPGFTLPNFGHSSWSLKAPSHRGGENASRPLGNPNYR